MRLFESFLDQFPGATFGDFLYWNANQSGYGGGGGALFGSQLSGQYQGQYLLNNFGGDPN